MNKKLLLSFFVGVFSLSAMAQEPQASGDKVPTDHYVFTTVKKIGITPIKNQYRSGTCWAYSGEAFFEVEARRNSGIQVDLSPMFVVNHSYKDKARKYVRMHGFLNFAQGGSFYDDLYVMEHYGAVPMSVMRSINKNNILPVHNELEAVAKGYLKALVEEADKAHKLSDSWEGGYNGIIDSYLGKLPETFTFDGKTYTPKSFAAALKINPEDYVSLTSYTHHPFYKPFILEVPDNWRMSESYNLPIDELMEVFDYAINHDYPIAWGSDVSEAGFTRDGIAVLVDTKALMKSSTGSDQEKWVGKSHDNKKLSIMEMIHRPNCPEVTPTQETRQEGFNDYELTDDHGMMIFGIAKDQFGKKFYMVKNSWGFAGTYKGIWYASENFVKGKTMNILVNKKAIPANIRKKLGI